MNRALLSTQTLETLRVPQDLATLLAQRGDLGGEFALLDDRDREDLLGFLPSQRPAESWQAKGDTNRILRLPHPMAFGHRKERLDRIGTDRQADVIESQALGGFELECKIGAELLAYRGGGHGVKQRLTLRQGVMTESLGFENLLARQQPLGIAQEALDEIFTGGQVIETNPQTGEDGTGLGSPGRRELEQLLSPGKEAVHIHKAGLGAHGGRCQRRQQGVLELARDASAGRHKALESGMALVRAFEHARHRVREVIEARAGQTLFGQLVDSFMQLTAAVFEVRRGSAHLRDEPLEHLGNGVARPGISHRDREAVGMGQRECCLKALMVMGIKR